MGLMVSVVITYVGVKEAIKCLRHMSSGVIPENQPGFEELVEYYTTELRRSAKTSNSWFDCSQGYVSLSEDGKGRLQSEIKYYNEKSDSTPLLFSTRISSFGQESVEEPTILNGGFKPERYSPTRTKTIVSNSSESFSVGQRGRSPTPIKVNHVTEEKPENEKLNWAYNPQSPPPTPEIHFESYDDDHPGVYNEDFLRSLDGIKYRPLQRHDPSGRRRSFKKRRSSSSTSSKDSRASRKEELNMFTSLEEAEFERMNNGEKADAFGSAPNLSARSHSRSRSRERRNENWSLEASTDSAVDDNEVKAAEHPKLESFDEEPKENKEVIEEEEEEVDFWGNMED